MGVKKKLAGSYYKFCLADGNQHIASEYAVYKIQKLIRKFDIKNVLKVGLGIGSNSEVLLNLKNY